MAERTGLPAVLDEIAAGDDLLPSGAEQMALLGMAVPASKKLAGRPPGRRNRRTAATAEYIRRTVGDPLLELARMSMLGVEELSAALGVSKGEAFAEKRLCLIALLPYTDQRQPIAVDVRDHKVVSLTIFEGSASASEQIDSDVFTIAGTVAEIVTNQEVGDGRE